MPKSAMTISDEGSLVRKRIFSGLLEKRDVVRSKKKRGHERVRSNVLEIPMDNMVLVQVLYARQHGSQNGDGIPLREVAALADPLKELTADCKLEREVIR